MLNEITIENVAVIEKAQVHFGPGFTVLTGETGAGKSILIDSINAILGSKASRELVRSGAAKASVWASFTGIGPECVALLQNYGYEAEDELLLYREVSAEGKSSCRINGAPVTAAILRAVGASLIQIHGQNDNQTLTNPAVHIALLDSYAKNETLQETYYQAYTKLQALHQEMAALSLNEDEKRRKIDLLQFETQEIEDAALEPGEEERLQEKRKIAQHSKAIVGALQYAHLALSGTDDEEGALTLLGRAAGELNGVGAQAPALQEAADALNELYYSAEEWASTVQRMADDYTLDEGDLNLLEARLDLLYRLKQKYGPSVEAVIAYGEKARTALAQIESASERLAQLAAEQKVLEAEVGKLAGRLTQSRQEAFSRLNDEIIDSLRFLNMPGIALDLHCETVPPGPKGQDALEFYISTNPGEKPKPLAKVASGGELARIMLALKNALAEQDALDTVIYDEIDTGISGSAAGRIGQMLRNCAGGRQVICVTHTAQVASYAREHLLIEKAVEQGRTYTHIQALDPKARKEELARIISGDKVTEIALANAGEMLELAQQGAAHRQ